VPKSTKEIKQNIMDTIIFQVVNEQELKDIAFYLADAIFEINVSVIDLQLIVAVTFELKSFAMVFNIISDELYNIKTITSRNQEGYTEYELFNGKFISQIECHDIWREYTKYF